MFVPRSVKRSIKSKGASVGSASSFGGHGPSSFPEEPAAEARSRAPTVPTPAPIPTPTSTPSISVTERIEAVRNEEYDEIVSLMEWVLSDDCLRIDPHGMEFAKWIDRHRDLPISQILSDPSFGHLSISHPVSPHALSLGLRSRRILHGRLSLIEPKVFGSAKSRRDTEGGLWVGRMDYEPVKFRQKLDSWATHSEGMSTELELYVENIPSSQKTYTQILSFVNTVFAPPTPDAGKTFQVASLSFPLKARGYGFVCVPSREERDRVLDEWSWEGARERARDKGKAKAMTGAGSGGGVIERIRKEARLAGFRCLSRTEYDRLEREYSGYLESRMNAVSEERKARKISAGTGTSTSTSISTSASTSSIVEGETSGRKREAETRLDYPEGCLLFVRRLDPDTSKTTIKDLFVAILRESRKQIGKEGDETKEAGAKGKNEVGYVDWIKGGDSCHVRVSDPSVSQQITSFLSSRPVFHLPLSAGLDGWRSGLPGGTTDAALARCEPMEVEIVAGDRERIYWMANVKEAVRAEAVRVAAAAAATSTEGPGQKRRRI